LEAAESVVDSAAPSALAEARERERKATGQGKKGFFKRKGR
jgi:hypothetical protein